MNGERLRVRDAFGRAADAYDAAAEVQRDIGNRLLSGLNLPTPPRRIADIGCGTGWGLAALSRRWPATERIAIDFALPMLARVPAAAARWRLCADAEAVPLAAVSVDLVWSNLALQWCELRRFAASAARMLRPGGQVAVSTLGPGTFGELRRAFAEADGYRHTLDFCDLQALVAAFAAAGLRPLAVREEAIVRRHPDLRGLLAEIRDIGANRVVAGQRRRSLMGKSAWRRFEAAYERQRDAAGLPLTYDTLYLYAEK